MMNESITQVRGSPLELPASAPQIRITAGIGSPAQKTWNLRRPVTLVGAKRPASIVLHDGNVSKAHCVIVNTGTEVLLKDLHTAAGTFLNKERVDLAVLSDGDVVTIGGMRMQIAIRVPADVNEDSGCDMAYVEPTKFPKPVVFSFGHTGKQWRVADAVTLIGRHNDAAVRLDHEEISTRHALIFRFGEGPAVFDLGSRTGILVNGDRGPQFALRAGDHIGLGPFSLTVCGAIDEKVGAASHKAGPSEPQIGDWGAGIGDCKPAPDSASTIRNPPSDILNTKMDLDEDPGRALARIETDLAGLQKNIAGSWDRLNAWESQLRRDTNVLGKQKADLATREADLEAKDAALRGQLHDLTRYQEEIAARERELAQQLARIQATHDELSAAQTNFSKQEEEFAKQSQDLQRREHVLTQRWTRLMTATCSHCGKRVNGG